jgi:hypothetical protein
MHSLPILKFIIGCVTHFVGVFILLLAFFFDLTERNLSTHFQSGGVITSLVTVCITIHFKMCASITKNWTEPENDAALQTFVELFERKNQHNIYSDSIDHKNLQQLAGHVTNGSKEEDFAYLQKAGTAKRLAWVIGDDGLTLFLTQSNLQAVRSIGYEDRSIRKKLEDGLHFRLGIFYKSDKCVPATWDGVLSLVDAHYPNSISSKIRRHVDALKKMSFDEIEARARLSYLAGASYFDVHQLAAVGNSTDPRFMSEERFSECEGTLEESRGFLYHRLGLSNLFDGSGFTKDSNGVLFVREYLQPNVLVRDIAEFRYLDLPIDISDLMPDA